MPTVPVEIRAHPVESVLSFHLYLYPGNEIRVTQLSRQVPLHAESPHRPLFLFISSISRMEWNGTVLPEAQACSLRREVGPALPRDPVKLSPKVSEWKQCLLPSEAATEFPRASLRLASYHGDCKTLSKVSESQFVCVVDATHNDLALDK